jgi:hypothetical protein
MATRTYPGMEVCVPVPTTSKGPLIQILTDTKRTIGTLLLPMWYLGTFHHARLTL